MIANLEQARAWDGDEGDHRAEHYERYDRSVRGYHERLLQAARIAQDDRVLDVGCGNGQSTRDAARVAAAGRVLGVDLSNRMIERARELSTREGLGNIRFMRADAQVHPFPAETFDVVISRFGAMFFIDHVAAFRNIAAGMKAGARLASVSWQPFRNNEWILQISDCLAGETMHGPPENGPNPFGLAKTDYIRAVLTEAGFDDIDIQDVREPFFLGAHAGDALAFLQGSMGWIPDDPDGAAETCALEKLRNILSAHETADGVVFGSAAWVVTARRTAAANPEDLFPGQPTASGRRPRAPSGRIAVDTTDLQHASMMPGDIGWRNHHTHHLPPKEITNGARFF